MIYLFFVFLFGIIYKLSKATAHGLPCKPPEKPPNDTSAAAVRYDPRQREKEKKREREKQLAQLDYEYFSGLYNQLNQRAADIEKRLDSETGEKTIATLQKQLETINAKVYAADRKRMIAFNKIRDG